MCVCVCLLACMHCGGYPDHASGRFGVRPMEPLTLAVADLDPDLLQLPADFTPFASPSSSSPASVGVSNKLGGVCRLHLEELYAQWISLPDTQRLVSDWVAMAVAGLEKRDLGVGFVRAVRLA